MEIETICRYKLPVCIVIFNNDGIYRGTDVNAVSSDPATTVFVKGARYDKMMEAFGGVGVTATLRPDECGEPSSRRWTQASRRSSTRSSIRKPAASRGASAISNPQSALEEEVAPPKGRH
jgi:oxalyl-CoA decarboxylase